ncbi:LOW QUALITY PROTEIN: F-box/kelch-repeat protein At5g26960 [Phalaenopsis equestris]|uniref:LOW QUALITY PROTEIN: F-box/kelch-repeat protein At5g26960 n=1 Tax=Phalaenopsis equestris TaxID=78828 RepID=UPI0009E58298|nr:LOW QUALITY PROTEIN: F-box/kelch-repeat protein At5g26960 [Phalaenopsis equestris]
MGESRGFSWLVKSCIADSCREIARSPAANHRHPNEFIPSDGSRFSSPIFNLPDDLLFECFSKVPLSTLPSLSLVCRRFAILLDNPAFHDLRRSRGRLRRTLFAICISDLGIITSTALPVPFPTHLDSSIPISFSTDLPADAFFQPRLAAIGRSIYIIGRGATLRYDTLTGAVAFRAPTIFPRKKFAAAVIGCRIYVSGGATRTSDVEEYNPEADEWRGGAGAPKRGWVGLGRVGAAAGGIFYVIGGLRVGSRREEEEEARGAHTCAGSMDAYHVRAGVWLRVRAVVPGGGCIVGACGAGAHVYVLASHAVELSFWRWDGKGRRGGDWTRLEPPPVGGQLRLGGAVHFSCTSIGDAKLAALVHASASHGGDIGRRSRGGEAVLLVYDIEADEWSRGLDLPPGLRRAVCAYVEC